MTPDRPHPGSVGDPAAAELAAVRRRYVKFLLVIGAALLFLALVPRVTVDGVLTDNGVFVYHGYHVAVAPWSLLIAAIGMCGCAAAAVLRPVKPAAVVLIASAMFAWLFAYREVVDRNGLLIPSISLSFYYLLVSAPVATTVWRAESWRSIPKGQITMPGTWAIILGFVPLILAFAIQIGFGLLQAAGILLTIAALAMVLVISARSAKRPSEWHRHQWWLRGLALYGAVAWILGNVLHPEMMVFGTYDGRRIASAPGEVQFMVAATQYIHVALVPNLAMSLFFFGVGLLRASREADRVRREAEAQAQAQAESAASRMPEIPEWGEYRARSRA